MWKQWSGTVFIGLVVSLSSCGKKSDLRGDHQSERDRAWPDGAQIKLHVHSSVPDNFKDALKRAVEKQNSVLLKTIVFIDGTSLKTGFEHDPLVFNFEDVLHDDTNGIYFTQGDLPTTSEGGTPDAVTQSWFTNAEIGGGDIIFKSDRMKTEDQVEVVMIHELGHLLGLDHNDHEANDIMHPIIATSLLKNPFTPSYCRELSKRYSTRDCPTN